MRANEGDNTINILCCKEFGGEAAAFCALESNNLEQSM